MNKSFKNFFIIAIVLLLTSSILAFDMNDSNADIIPYWDGPAGSCPKCGNPSLRSEKTIKHKSVRIRCRKYPDKFDDLNYNEIYEKEVCSNCGYSGRVIDTYTEATRVICNH